METCFHFASVDSYQTANGKSRSESGIADILTQIYFLVRVAIMAVRTNLSARFGKNDHFFWINRSLDVLRLVESCGGQLNISGLENLRKTMSPVVLIGNHMSTLENLTLFGIIGPIKDVTYVVKKELVHHWIFGPVMRKRNPVVVRRENPREDLAVVLEKGTEKLGQGQSIVIFPQSTRRLAFDPSDFNSIGVKLALKAGVEIVPFAVKTDWWGSSRISSYFGKINRSKPIYIKFGEPIRVNGNGREEHLAVIRFISDRLKEWGL